MNKCGAYLSRFTKCETPTLALDVVDAPGPYYFHKDCIAQCAKCKIRATVQTVAREWIYDTAADGLVCFDCWPKIHCDTCPDVTVDPFVEGWTTHDSVWACASCSATCHMCGTAMPLGCKIVTMAWVYDLLTGYECNKHTY